MNPRPVAALFRWRLRHLRAQAGEPLRTVLRVAPWMLHVHFGRPVNGEAPPGVALPGAPRGLAAAARRLELPPPGAQNRGGPLVRRQFAVLHGARVQVLVQPSPGLLPPERARLERSVVQQNRTLARHRVALTFTLIEADALLPPEVLLHGAQLSGEPPGRQDFASVMRAAPFSSAPSSLGRALLLLSLRGSSSAEHLFAALESGLAARDAARPGASAALVLPPSSQEGAIARACVFDPGSYGGGAIALGRALAVAAVRACGSGRRDPVVRRVLLGDVLDGGFPAGLRAAAFAGLRAEGARAEVGVLREAKVRGGWRVSHGSGALLGSGRHLLHARGRALALLRVLGFEVQGVPGAFSPADPGRGGATLWVRIFDGGAHALVCWRARGRRPGTRLLSREVLVPRMARAALAGAQIKVEAGSADLVPEAAHLTRLATLAMGCHAGGRASLALLDRAHTVVVAPRSVRRFASDRFVSRPRAPALEPERPGHGQFPARGPHVVSCSVSVDGDRARLRYRDESGWWFEEEVALGQLDAWLEDARALVRSGPTPGAFAVGSFGAPDEAFVFSGSGAVQRDVEIAVDGALPWRLGWRVISPDDGSDEVRAQSVDEAAEVLLSHVPPGQQARLRIRSVELQGDAARSPLARLYARSVAQRRLHARIVRRSGAAGV